MKTLFSEITLRNLKIKNRIVMPPMVCFGYAGEDGIVTERNLKHYESLARGGTGLIIVEATCVNRTGRLSPVQLGLWSDEQIKGFSRIAEVCHKYSAGVLVQIHHAGLAVAEGITGDVFGPSEFQGKSKFGQEISARAMSQAEIRSIRDDFVAAALRAQKAGLDGIELHAAHGYLLSQFFSSQVNKRTDIYGGNPAKRTRLAADVITGIREVAGDNFIIDCRMGCNEPDLASSIGIARRLEKAGVDLLHISVGADNLSLPPVEDPPRLPEGFPCNWVVYSGTLIKKEVKVPVIVVSGIKTPQQAGYVIENGLADFAAIGRGLFIDPQWPNKAQAKQAITPCLDCKICSLFRSEMVCPQKK